MRTRKPWFFLFLLLVLVLPACSAGGEDPEPEENITTLIYAQISEDGLDKTAVSAFNRKHKIIGDVQIEVRNYMELAADDKSGKSAMDLLLTEIGAGKIPDIIDLGRDGQTCQLPYQKLVEKGYLEDLWPYIENDPKLGLDGVIKAPLKAVEIDGGLYTIFDAFCIQTLIGAKSVVGDRTGWTMDDLREAFAAMPEGSVLVDDLTGSSARFEKYGGSDMKTHMLNCFMYVYFDSLVDEETGKCHFDSPEFREILELVNTLPSNYDWKKYIFGETERDRRSALIDELSERKQDGIVMLDISGIYRIYNLQSLWFDFRGEVSLVGYPTTDGTGGSYFMPVGRMLSMSSTCKNKEAAWEVMRQMLMAKGELTEVGAVPVNATMYARDVGKSMNINISFEYRRGNIVHIPTMTRKDTLAFKNYVDSVTKCTLFVEPEILDMVAETAGPYFAGDRPLDLTVELIQNRVQLYINENR